MGESFIRMRNTFFANRNFLLDTASPCGILNTLAMNTKPETSLTKAADPASVFIASTLDTSTGSVAFAALENGDGLVSSNPNPDYLPPPAEAQDRPRSPGEEYFRFMVEMAVDSGHISRE